MSQPGGEHARHRVLATAGAFVAGTLLAVQSRMNGVIGQRSGQPIAAALWSFGSGLVVLTLLVAFVPRVRRGWRAIRHAVQDGRLHWWQCLGGFFGGLLVAVQAWSVPLVGVAIFSIGVVGGQTMCGLIVDRLGLGPAGVQHVTGVRVLAALVAVAGVVVSATGRGGGQFSLWPAFCAFLVGAGMAVQQALNGRVSVANRSPMATTWQNFFVGFITLLVVSGIVLAHSGPATWSVPRGVPWWALPGGLVGIVFIAITAWAVRITGVLVFGLVAVAGQLLAALVLDLLDAGGAGHPHLASGGGSGDHARRSRRGSLVEGSGHSMTWQDGAT